MDVPLKPGHGLGKVIDGHGVSILLLMDVPLKHNIPVNTKIPVTGFNPSFNGCTA